jgi:pimeloyl-ACP methyl ester carboxylesterase
MTPISATTREYHWSWQKRTITVVYDVIGDGQPILLLPAFSSVSMREEMHGLAAQLCQQYQVVIPDWPGFGQSSRPGLDYQPALYRAFLKDFVRSMFAAPVVVIAAGHAAGYVMELAQRSPAPWSWVVLVAPTWRGPLPTAMGKNRWLYSLLRFLIKLPIAGQLLYGLNTLPPFLRLMYRRHVFAEPKHVTRSLLTQKRRTTQTWGARHASAAFVTGRLDPVHQRSEFVDQFQPLPAMPVLVVIGEQTPPKSLAEMEFLAHFTGVQVYRLPGALGLHEEYADQLAAGILPFLRKYLS